MQSISSGFGEDCCFGNVGKLLLMRPVRSKILADEDDNKTQHWILIP